MANATMSTPHLMFYAPQLSNEEIGAIPNACILYPFIFKECIAEQSDMIQLIGEAERAKIISDEKPLLDESCAPIARFSAFQR